MAAERSEETVRDLIPRVEIPEPKAAMYVSKHPKTIAADRHASRTMGQPPDVLRAAVLDTSNYTRAVARPPPSKQPLGTFYRGPSTIRKDKTPLVSERPEIRRKVKDFIRDNISGVPLLARTLPNDSDFDWRNKDGYGEVPRCVRDVQKRPPNDGADSRDGDSERQGRDSEPQAASTSTNDIEELRAKLVKRLEALDVEFQKVSFGANGTKRRSQLEFEVREVEEALAYLARKRC